ncbi:MAG: MBOAT family protein [Bacteroidales bacterium]|nr:MBOAT family protein [Bacteroidales bacterium]MBR0453400.1 MBOAT family protein [Bacteroidales bacterium]
MSRILEFLSFNAETPLLFTQFYFWAFFALVFAVFSLLHNKLLLRNLFLFAASAFFYYKTSGICLLILLFCTLSDFIIAKRIHRSQESWKRKTWLALSIVLNLSLLCYFKYSYFVSDLLNNMLGTHLRVFNVFAWAGNELAGSPVFSVDRIILPVGISFYIFQTISYTMDVYRRRIQPVNSWLDYGFYVSFFPQLVAGPIVRANTFIPQIYKPFHLSRRQFGIAIFWILNGLVKKIVLSDYLAVNFIDRVFANPTMYSGFENLFSLFAYSLQVYADFSGYTDIAIGVAMLMGFYLPQNFNSPYKASNAGNFWKRWHISLSRWLQEYLYIPLGGNRKASFGTYFWIIAMALIAVALSRSLWLLLAVVLILGLSLFSTRRDADKRRRLTTNLNSLNTMLLGGLWHGASLNFVIWGGLNGAGVIIYKTWKNWSPLTRTLVMLSLFVGVYLTGTYLYPCAALNIAKIWIGLLCIGTLVRYMYHLFQTLSDKSLSLSVEAALSKVWGIAQTFVFITFTRLFFRSGSNLDPAEANRVAWETAVNMIEQIGGAWDVEIIPQVIQSYAAVFVLFILGMIIHWLPQNWKRRYRLAFAKMPLPCMVLVVVAVVFFVYQFITADLQAFIYFQF